MSEIISPLLEWLNAHPELAGLVTFIISAGESVAILGTIVPGSIMMTALGTLAGAGVIPLWHTILWAILGAIVGDSISYWIGYYFKDRLPKCWPFRTHPSLLKSGETFFHKYGSMSVFIGRFVGPVRALVPLVAGMLGMKPWKFTIANVASAIGWAPAYMLPGILLGAASLELPPDIAIHVILVLMLISLFVLLCLWFIYKLFQLIHEQIYQLQNKIWHHLKESRHLKATTWLLKHHDATKPHGQLHLALYFVFTGVLFLALTLYVTFKGPLTIAVNNAFFHFFRGIRTDDLDHLMINITLLGQKQVILPVTAILFAWLLFCRRIRAACYMLALGVFAGGSVFVIKHILKSPRPWGIFQSPETYSMPSGHTTLSATILMGITFLIALSMRESRRFFIYTITLIIIFTISISRLYLGAHWFTDILSGWLLSIIILLVMTIAYLRQPEKPINPLAILLVSLLAFMLTSSIYYHYNISKLRIAYAQVNWPIVKIKMDTWWQRDGELSAYRASLFGFPSQQINIEWAGNLEHIKQTLMKEGWSKPPVRDWISTLHRITDVKSTQYLPLISPQYLDKRPELILTRHTNGEKNLLVLRLWKANRIINETNSTLWVGIVSIVHRSYSWIFKDNSGDIQINPALVFPNKTGIGAWQWKIINLSLDQKMMLVRKNISAHKKK